MTNNEKNWIDNAPYDVLLRKWRFAAAGDPMFVGETGEYFAKVMTAKRDALDHDDAVRASKNVGWDAPS